MFSSSSLWKKRDTEIVTKKCKNWNKLLLGTCRAVARRRESYCIMEYTCAVYEKNWNVTSSRRNLCPYFKPVWNGSNINIFGEALESGAD